MNKQTKQLLLVGGSILVVVGVAYYLRKKRLSAEQEVLEDTLEDAVDSTKPNVIKTKPSGTPSLKVPKELDTPQKVQGFQAWMDAQGKPWINVNGKWHFLKEGNPNVGGKGLGNFGPATAQVWKIFGKKYLEALKKFNASV
jgi:hypothetical protein